MKARHAKVEPVPVPGSASGYYVFLSTLLGLAWFLLVSAWVAILLHRVRSGYSTWPATWEHAGKTAIVVSYGVVWFSLMAAWLVSIWRMPELGLKAKLLWTTGILLLCPLFGTVYHFTLLRTNSVRTPRGTAMVNQGSGTIARGQGRSNDEE